MSDELIVEDGGVDLDFDEVDGDGGDLGDHHAPKRVGHGGVGVPELEFGVVVFELADFDLRESLVRRAIHRRSLSLLSECQIAIPREYGFFADCVSSLNPKSGFLLWRQPE